MSTITIEIKAPELAHALETLAAAVGSIKIGGTERQTDREPYSNHRIVPDISAIQPQQVPIQQIPVTQQTPVQQMPVQNTPAQNVQIAPVNSQVAPQQPAPVQQPVQQTVPTQTQSFTMDQLAIAATQLMDAGKRNELIGLLGQFGVQALTALPKEQYGAFATALRGMGARI